ncbi:hypothetical protein E1176_07455 [Fulvivirga sp. RKSG066]|uniref:glycoside hydrolase family 113 n=1 Tax=Fulvivirga aurantia TaxID=2529383 RepID=UPI0012BCBC3D|nr:hypothetical protein [Fulvivirga aurantia]MTI20852.1 hypothetical protein [Fulvivirga aurantia]
MKRLFGILTILLLVTILLALTIEDKAQTKVGGVSFVAPPRPITIDDMENIKRVNAGWVAIIPYAFSRQSQPEVNFNYERQWWGEKVEGSIETIKMSQDLGLKVMLKPHVWVRGEGWAGDFDLQSDEDWQKWETDYTKYVLTYARIADSLDVELLCIGTEYRKAVVKRPEYWKYLIKEIRKVYTGRLTYAANWDNFEQVTFWGDLDFIGIDAYFPLSQAKTPMTSHLENEWQKIIPSIERLHNQYDKPVLFTEYGYQSIDFTTGGHWNYNQDTLNVNLAAQMNAYEGLYQAVWNEEWFAGGFLWKWHAKYAQYGGNECKRFTPQNKPVESLIGKWYAK